LRLEVWRASGTTINIPAETVSWRDSADDLNGLHIAILQSAELLAATRLNYYHKFTDIPVHKWLGRLTEKPQEPLGVIARLVVSPSAQHLDWENFLIESAFMKQPDRAALRFCASCLLIASLHSRGWDFE
jgi:hypothetical protein